MPERRSVLDRLADHGVAKVEAGERTVRIQIPDDLQKDYRTAIVGAASLIDSARERQQELQEDGRYSPEGVREKMESEVEDFLSTDFNADAREGRHDNLAILDQYARDAVERADELRVQLSEVEEPEPEDEADVALDREVRDYLRGLDQDERRRKLRKAAVEGREDVVRAALSGPPELSGMTEEHRERVRDLWRKNEHPELIEELEQAEQTARRMTKARDRIAEALEAIASEEPTPAGAPA